MALAPWFAPSMVPVYLHTLVTRVRREARGHTRHRGDAAAIVRACIEACWNGRTFTASPGHFDMFWTRDLCFSAPSLVRVGSGSASAPRSRMRSRSGSGVAATSRRPSTTSTGRPTSSPTGSTRFRFSWRRCGRPTRADLVERHRSWLDAEIAWFHDRVVDPATGLVRSDRTYSAHRDTVVNRSNAYGNTMVALLARTLAETGWFASPFERHFGGDHGRLLRERFWAGDHFRDALGDDVVSGEANIWPFYAGVVTDPAMVASALGYLEANGFCDPYPLRYDVVRRPEREVWFTRHVLPDYQGSTVWTSLGAMYLQLLGAVDPARAATEIARYAEWIERDGTFWEVLDSRGRPWVSPRWLFIGEESMLWSAIFLDALENGRAGRRPYSSPASIIALSFAGPDPTRGGTRRRTTARRCAARRETGTRS